MSSNYRANRDEAHFTPAQKVAWEYVLPYMYLPVIDSDIKKAQGLSEFLEKTFPEQALIDAAESLKKKKEEG